MTSRSTDLWSMSCLMLEVAVWLGGGTQAATEFFRTRVHKNEQSDRFPTSPSIVGYEDCFHNGEEALTSAKGIAVSTNRNQWVFDGITGRIVDFLVENILVNAKQRPGIGWTARRLREIIDVRNSIPRPSPPAVPSSPTSSKLRADSGVNWGTGGSIPRRLSTKSDDFKSPPQAGEQTRVPLVRKPPKHSEATVDYVSDYRDAWEWSREPDLLKVMEPFLADVRGELDGRDQVCFATCMKGPKPCTGGNEEYEKITAANTAYQIFLIDNYSDMIEHEGQLKRALEAIVKVVKHVDRDGLEVWFTPASREDTCGL